MTITLHRGQVVHWPPSPSGLAQIEELRRTRVRLFYAAKTGREFRPVIPVAALASIQQRTDPPLPIRNLFGRAAIRRSKTFEVANA